MMKLRIAVQINFTPEILDEMGENSGASFMDRIVNGAEASGAKIVKATDTEAETVGEYTLMECYKKVATLDVSIGAMNQDFAMAMVPDMDNISEALQGIVQAGLMHREEIETDNPVEERSVRLVIGQRIPSAL